MENVVYSRLVALRKAMLDAKADWYFMTSDDFHASEYIADYFKIREHFSGFTGENAFLIVGKEEAYLWVDGRFFIQAENELAGTSITMMKMGEPGVPTLIEFIKANVKAGESFFFDGRMVSTSMGKKVEKVLCENGADLVFKTDIADKLWTDRPSLPVSEVKILSTDVTGESFKDKVTRIRQEMAKEKCQVHFIGSIDDIAWITNMRGADIECNPVFLAYMLLTDDSAIIFMQKKEAGKEVVDYLKDNGFTVEDYDNILDYLTDYNYFGNVLLDTASVNYSCYKTISEKAVVVDKMNPSKRMKCIKNETEIKRLKEAYLEDSVCVTKFIYWLKNAVKTEKVTEISAANYIDNLRRQVPGFLDLSFPTISGYGSNGAIVHYGVTEESNAVVKPEGMLLVDSGGQYEKGTTDVTRTVACGPVTDSMKLHYTKVAVGMLSLANARFLYGCTGRNLDILSRAPLWNMAVDYKHGTGHGVGYILNVHEGPQSIRWQYVEGAKEQVLEPGMITSDEPGVYIKDQFGIRIENIILCVDDVTNSDGRFLKFEHLTYSPLDRALLDKSVLSPSEIELINDYQETVYQRTYKLLTDEEAKWLRQETLPL